MRVVYKKHIKHLYKVTCRDVFYLLNGTYRKRLGSRIVTSKQIKLTTKELDYLMSINCKGKAILGYFVYDRKNKHYYFVDIATFYQEFICIEDCLKNKK